MEEQQRLEEVHHWQRMYKMTPRSDSRLTQRYVKGEIAWRADEVARELLATDYLYKQTLYGECLEEYMRAVAHTLRQRFPRLTWSETWTIVQFYGPLSLKLLMMLSCQGCVPQECSWS